MIYFSTCTDTDARIGDDNEYLTILHFPCMNPTSEDITQVLKLMVER